MDEVFDRSELLDECDGDRGYLGRMLEMLEHDLNERLPRLQRAVESKDFSAIMQDAHAVKGGVGNFFAKAAFETALQLEMMGRNEQLTGVDETFRRLQDDLKKLRHAIKALVDE